MRWCEINRFWFSILVVAFIGTTSADGMAQDAAPLQVTSQQTGSQQTSAPAVMPVTNVALNTTGKMKIEISGLAGVGAKSIDLGTTTSGDAVKVSGGGGAGLALTVGYGLSPKFEIDVSVGVQKSAEQPVVENADASFTRSFFRATLKYLVPISARLRFKLGGGFGVYSGGELDVDTTRVFGGSRDIVKYDSAQGAHVGGEFEGLISNGFTYVAGLRLYSVKYKANSWEHNGVAQPVGNLTDKARNLEGGGADIFIGLAKYF